MGGLVWNLPNQIKEGARRCLDPIEEQNFKLKLSPEQQPLNRKPIAWREAYLLWCF